MESQLLVLQHLEATDDAGDSSGQERSPDLEHHEGDPKGRESRLWEFIQWRRGQWSCTAPWVAVCDGRLVLERDEDVLPSGREDSPRVAVLETIQNMNTRPMIPKYMRNQFSNMERSLMSQWWNTHSSYDPTRESPGRLTIVSTLGCHRRHGHLECIVMGVNWKSETRQRTVYWLPRS